jgi:hypothetical protein
VAHLDYHIDYQYSNLGVPHFSEHAQNWRVLQPGSPNEKLKKTFKRFQKKRIFFQKTQTAQAYRQIG